MYQASHHDLDHRLARTLDRVGVVGDRFRQTLARDLKAKMILRGARDVVDVVGPAGSGKHTVASVAHAAGTEVLGRADARVDLDCSAWVEGRRVEQELRDALAEAEGGTLVLDRFDTLDSHGRGTARRVLADRGDTLVLTIGRGESATTDAEAPSTRIRLKPLHEREDDIWELVDHFFAATARDCEVGACRGFSRQAKADIAAAIRETGLGSVQRLRDVVRDLVFEALADGELPLKLTSDHVRAYLAEHFGQSQADREERDAALIASSFGSMVDRRLLDTLATTHGVPADLLERQAIIIREIVGYIDDVPRSYRNSMDRTDDIMRASLWLMTGATTQAEFRRFFGEERFMRPTKSVAWAFYNRVFKRDV